MRQTQTGSGSGTSCTDGVGDEGMYWPNESWEVAAWRAIRALARLTRVGCMVCGLEGMECGELMDGLELPDMLYL